METEKKNKKYIVRYLSRNSVCLKIHPWRDAVFDVGHQTALRILKFLIVSLQSGFCQCYQEFSHVINMLEFLIDSPFKMNLLHLLLKFRAYILSISGEK